MKPVLLLFVVFATLRVFAQPAFSVATQLCGLRNVTPKEKFWAIGQTVQGNIHLSPRNTAYASLAYVTEGKFKNTFTATAQSAFTMPQTLLFTATGRLRYRQVSLGLVHYFKGGFQSTGVNLYGTAGFGYLFALVQNSASPEVDTTAYTSPVAFGGSKIKRLSFDLGLGSEVHLGGPVYGFADLRTWLPASYHPSPYLHNSDRVPLALLAGAGVRVLLGPAY